MFCLSTRDAKTAKRLAALAAFRTSCCSSFPHLLTILALRFPLLLREIITEVERRFYSKRSVIKIWRDAQMEPSDQVSYSKITTAIPGRAPPSKGVHLGSKLASSNISSLPHPSQLSLTQAKAPGQGILREKDWNRRQRVGMDNGIMRKQDVCGKRPLAVPSRMGSPP